MHDQNLGAELPDHIEVVGDEEDGSTVLPVDLFQQLQDLRLDGHVQGGGRLVGQQQLGMGDDGGGDHDPLEHPARQLVRILVIDGLRVGQLCLCHGGEGGSFPLLRGFLGVDAQGLLHLGADLHDRIQAGHRLLEHYSQVGALAAAQLFRGAVQDVQAVQQDAAGAVRFSLWEQAADGHGSDRFTGTRLAHQADDGLICHREANALHGVLALWGTAEMNPQVFDFQHSAFLPALTFSAASPLPTGRSPR